VVLLDKATNASGTKELAFAVGGFGDAVGVEDEDVANVQGDAPLVVLNFFENTEGKAGELDAISLPTLVEKRL